MMCISIGYRFLVLIYFNLEISDEEIKVKVSKRET
jgi:hypothetical protein